MNDANSKKPTWKVSLAELKAAVAKFKQRERERRREERERRAARFN